MGLIEKIWLSISSFVNLSTIALFILSFIFTIIMLIDCIKRDKTSFENIFFEKPEWNKIVWLVIIIFPAKLFGLGAIVYYLYFKFYKK